MDPLVEETMDAYGYCFQNPIELVDPDGRGPKPAPLSVELAIKGFGDMWFRAFKSSNNTSTGDFNNWVRGRGAKGGWGKALGVIGEGTFAASLDNAARLGSKVYFGSEIYKDINKISQVDVVEVTVLGTLNGMKAEIGTEKHIINYAFDGTENSPIVESIQGKSGGRVVIQNFEVKTLGATSSVESLFSNLSKGIEQAITSGLGKKDHIYGVLVTDTKAWNKVANDPVYG